MRKAPRLLSITGIGTVRLLDADIEQLKKEIEGRHIRN